jgi:CheY-like chemotaxis protein
MFALVVSTAASQDPPANQKRPVEAFREIRDLVNDGRYELAAESIKDFLGLRPTDQDYLDIQARYGPTAFLRLRNIPRWYDDAKKDAEFKAGPLQQMLEASMAATNKLVRDPKRVERFVYNLGASREEYLFAVQELRRSGDFAVPIMVTILRTDNTPELRQGILSAVRGLGVEIVPGFIAATEGLPDDLKIGILQSLANRSDVLSLVGKTDTDFTPHLWYLASAPASQPTVTRNAAELLRQLTGGSADTRQAAAELVALATPLYQRKGQFATLDKVKNRVTVWEWDPAAQTVRPFEVPPSQAEERLGLKYLRWAVERKPGYEPAEEMFLAFATERAVERANFGTLATAEPNVYRVLAAAPAAMLTTLLETALAENRTAQALGLIQVLGDRAERVAATQEVRARPGADTPAIRPAPFVRALNYPDPRVQLAAAVALLRTPHPTPTGANARVVEILRRSITGDEGDGTPSKGRALLADPKTSRADQVATLLRGIGYTTEQFGTGRDLLRRIQRSADFDLVLLDRHIAGPELTDILAHMKADANFARRPVLVIASSDQPRPVSLEQQLLRLALLVAATETEDVPIPGVVAIDRRKSPEEIAEDKQRNAVDRDRAFALLYRARLDRLTRLVDASGVLTNEQIRERMRLRLPQLTYAGLIAEYAPPRDTAPQLYRDYEKVAGLLQAHSDLDRAVEGITSDALVKLILQLESALTQPLRQRFEALRNRLDPQPLGIRADPARDMAVEFALARQVRTSPGTVVIPEPFSRIGFEDDVRAAFADPAQLPRDPAEKKSAARTAVEWLRKMAVGEVAGYDIRPAGPALRQALQNDELAEPAIEAVGHLPSAEAQQDLLKVTLSTQRPAALRLKAADAVSRHVQVNGRLTVPEIVGLLPQAIAEEKNPEIKARLEVIRTLLAGMPGDLSERIREFRMPLPSTPAPKPPTSTPSDPKENTPPGEPKK